MKILLYNSHPPYSFDLIRGLPGAYFYHVGWANFLRPDPPNTTIVPDIKEVEGERFDVAITDHDDFWFSDIFKTLKVAKKIHIFHCQNCNDGDPKVQAQKEKVCQAVDAIVTPSEHKMMTYRELSFKYPFHVIPLGVNGEDYPIGSRDSGYIGIVHNVLHEFPEMSPWWKKVCEILGDRKKVLIGQGNKDLGYHKCDIWIPSGWDEYRKMIGSLNVFINCVPSEIAGYTPREVMASGVPVISAIMTDFSECGFNGWNMMVYLGSTGQGVAWLADTAKYVFDHPDYAAGIGHWGRETILRKYPLEIFQEMWRGLIYDQA